MSMYITAFTASVVPRYSASDSGPGEPMKSAMSRQAPSNSAVISTEARDWPRWTFS